MNYFMIADNVKAMKDIWILRDGFLYDTFTSFQANCHQTKREKKEQPFMNSYYNVKFFFQHPLSNIRHVETRIFNSLVEGMKNYEKLPKYIIVILEKDLIESIGKFEFGAKISMGRAVDWLIDQMD